MVGGAVLVALMAFVTINEAAAQVCAPTLGITRTPGGPFDLGDLAQPTTLGVVIWA